MSKAKISALAASRFGLSAEYWNRLGASGREMYEVVQPLCQARYSVDHPIHSIEAALKSFEAESGGGSLDLNPDFQRGNVWTRPQQVAYVENVLRGVAPTVFRFNHPGYDRRIPASGAVDALPVNQMLCVDGLQRLTALRAFVAGEFKVFDRWLAKDLEEGPFSLKRFRVSFEVFSIPTRRELLKFYLDLNAGGTVHTEAELARVREMLAAIPSEPSPSAVPSVRRKPR